MDKVDIFVDLPFCRAKAYDPHLCQKPLQISTKCLQAQETIARRICQHVVGMNPASLGDFNDEVVKREIVDDTFDIEVKEGEDEKMVS